MDIRPAGHLVESKQQARNGRFAGAGRSDHGYRVARGHLESQPFEDLPVILIGETDILETDRATLDLQRLCARRILDLGIAGEDRKHVLDVDHCLLDLAIDHAHEIERLIELDHHGVDHDKVADRVGALSNAQGTHHHHSGETQREDGRLTRIEHSERNIGFDARFLIAGHGSIVAPRLPFLGAEIFHGLVIEQRIDRLHVGVSVAVVHPAANADAPFRGDEREHHVAGHRGQR